MASKKQFELTPRKNDNDTYGVFSKKQTDTIGKLIPKIKLSRKQRKFNEAKKEKFQNYVAESKRDFPSFDQKTDTVVSTTTSDYTVGKRLNQSKAYGAQVGNTGGKPVSSSLIGTKEKVTMTGKNLQDRKFTFKRMVKKPKKK